MPSGPEESPFAEPSIDLVQKEDKGDREYT